MRTQAARTNSRSDTTLLEVVRQIAPVVREYNDEAERERRLSKPVFSAMAEAGLFRMFNPVSLGGLEVDPLTCARVVEEIARSDSAAGWALFNHLSYALICARLPDEGAEEIFAESPDAVIAGPFHPPMQATLVDGGYRVSGRSPFASNCRDANWLAATALVLDGGQPRTSESGAPEVILAVLHAADCEILDTWHVMGMRGTGSDDIAVQDVFVPATRTCPLLPEFKPGSHYQGPLYRFSLMGAVAATFAPILLAICRNAIDEVLALAQRKTPFGSATLLRERVTAQSKIAKAEGTLRSARTLLYDTLGEMWDRILAGKPLSIEDRAALLLATTNTTNSAGKVAELVYGVAGTTGIYTKNPLERHFRDVQVLKQHGFASESRYEAVGQVYLGLSPEWAPMWL
ncbi:MAG: acyl-CoA dehydrogenase family protein [Bryobacteraceae bacterium]